MKKKLLLIGLLCYSTAFGNSGLFGSQVNYQDVVLVTAVGAFAYACKTCQSVLQLGDVVKQYVSLAIAGGAGIAVLYSRQFNDMIPKDLRTNEFFDGLNKFLPYWFSAVIAGATYSNFCDRYDAFFKPKKKEEGPKKPPAVELTVNT